MTREEILKEVKKYFDVDELVCNHIFDKWKQNSWQFLDTDFLHCLLIIRRDIIQKPMYCNGNQAHQRGVRCNRCDLVKQKNTVYVSSHILGKAGDFSCPVYKADKMRELIKEKKDLLPCPIRMEADVSWLHFDVLPQCGVTDKVYEFKG